MGWGVAMEIAPATNAVSKLSQDGSSGRHLFYSAVVLLRAEVPLGEHCKDA